MLLFGNFDFSNGSMPIRPSVRYTKFNGTKYPQFRIAVFFGWTARQSTHRHIHLHLLDDGDGGDNAHFGVSSFYMGSTTSLCFRCDDCPWLRVCLSYIFGGILPRLGQFGKFRVLTCCMICQIQNVIVIYFRRNESRTIWIIRVHIKNTFLPWKSVNSRTFGITGKLHIHVMTCVIDLWDFCPDIWLDK